MKSTFTFLYITTFIFFTAGKSTFAEDRENKSQDNEKTVVVAVRAHSGIEEAEKKWSATMAYLSEKLEGYSFRLLPLVNFEDMREVVKNNKVDFVLTNPTAYIDLSVRFGVARIATLINGRDNHGKAEFGGVVFTRSDRDDINGLHDVKGRSIMGVHKEAFGGWRMAHRELLCIGIDPFTDCSEVLFSPDGTQESVVLNVLQRNVDVGTVRTGILEAMEQKGIIELKNIKILNPQKDEFPLPHTTSLYPEWPFSVLRNTDEVLAKKVAIALMQMDKDDPAAKQGGYLGWQIPLSYNQVLLLLKELKITPFEHYGEVSIAGLLKQYWYLALLGLLILIALVSITIRVSNLNRILNIRTAELQKAKDRLDERVKERTNELKLEIRGHRRTGEALLLSRSRYQSLFDDSPVALWEEDFSELFAYFDKLRKKGIKDFRIFFDKNPGELQICVQKIKIKDVNKATLDLYKAKSKKDLFDNLEKIFTQNSYLVFKEEMIAMASGQHEFESEAEVQTLTGEIKYIFLKLVVNESPPNSIRALLATTDITERKQTEQALRESEARLKEAEELALLGHWELDLQKNILYWSDEIYRIFEIDPHQFGASYEAFLETVHPDDRELVNRAYRESVKNRTLYSVDHRILLRDGRVKYVHEQGRTYFDENGHAIRSLGTVQDITKRKQTEEELKKINEQLRALAAHLELIREEERMMIAREIHDELGQILTVLKMDLTLMGRELSEEENLSPKVLLDEIKSMTALIDTSIKQVRKLITELRPEVLDNLGLIAALEWQIQEFQAHSKMECKFETDLENIEISDDKAIAIFRIFQEALTNIIRHAQASRVSVNIKKEDNSILLKIADNGIGMAADILEKTNTFGLLGMQERAIVFGGEVNIQSEQGKGTVITVKIPATAA